MVVIGGITRLTHSGLSMVDWHLIIGAIPPMNEQEWISAFEAYKTSPEFKELNFNFSLGDFKQIFWWEYIHRLLGRVLGVVFIIPFIFFLVKGWIKRKLGWQLLVVFALGAFQAFLGWFMVKSGLVNEPRVSHYRLAAHLITAFITCMVILWICLGIYKGEQLKPIKHPMLKVVWGFGVLIVFQIIYGAFVAGTHAGEMHNTFPLMDGHLVAPSVFSLDPVYLNFLEGKSGVQFIHRLLGIGAFLYAIAIYVKGLKAFWLKDQILAVRLVLICVFIQFLLGVATLLLQVPIELGVIHQLGALLVLASVVYLLHSIKYPAIPETR